MKTKIVNGKNKYSINLKIKDGSIVKVETDIEGIPVNVFWRRRLRDSKTDGCCSLVEDVVLDEVKVEVEKEVIPEDNSGEL